MENSKAGTKEKKYFLQVYQELSYRHGGIGNLDVEKILSAEGFQSITLPENPGFLLYLRRWWAMRRELGKIAAGSIVLVQFPVYATMYRVMLRKLLRRKVKLVILINDIDGLKDQDALVLENEISQLRQFNHFIVHNQAMENWLRSVYPGANMVQLGPFDYLAHPNLLQREQHISINFSGNLRKSEFISQLRQMAPIPFHLYGESIDEDWLASNLTYHGSLEPAEMPGTILGSYGLVWDGSSIHGAEGSLGHYMQYINHHKLSLYILAGMPIIAPAFAGSAAFISAAGIGWLVNDLAEIPELLGKITPEAYQLAQLKMVSFALAISNGNHLKTALEKLFNSSAFVQG